MARRWKDEPAFAENSTAYKFVRPAAYGRYSSDKQTESEADQRQAFQRIAERHDLPWNGLAFFDPGVSGWKEREGLTQLVSFIRQEKKAGRRVDAVIVRESSRLSRGEPMDVVGGLLKELRDLGVRAVFSEDRGRMDLPASHDMGQFIRWGVEAGLAHAGATTIAFAVSQSFTSKVSRSIAEASKTPGWSQSGQPRTLKTVGARPPFGYQDDVFGEEKFRLFTRTPHPELAAVTKQIFRWFLDGKTSRWIACELNRRDVRSPMQDSYPQRKLTWNGTQVDFILQNVAYLGTYCRGLRSQGAFFHVRKTGPVRVPDALKAGRKNGVPAVMEADPDDCHVLDDCWEPLISKRDFDRVQKRLRERRNAPKKTRATSGALSGVACCGCCGRPMRLLRTRGRTAYVCQRNPAGVVVCKDGGLVWEDELLPRLIPELLKAAGKESDRLKACLAQPTTGKVNGVTLAREKRLEKELDTANKRLASILTRPEVPEAAVDTCIGVVEKLTAELSQVRAERQRAEQLPADRERELREQLAWLAKHAVALHEWNVISPKGKRETRYTADDTPAMPPFDDDEPGTSARSKLLHYDTSKLRALCGDLDLHISVRWTGKPGQRGRVASASFTTGCRMAGSPRPASGSAAGRSSCETGRLGGLGRASPGRRDQGVQSRGGQILLAWPCAAV